MIKLLSRFVLALVSSSICCGALSVTATHDPLYRAEAHTSTISAIALDEQDGVAEVSIQAIEGELTACTEDGGTRSVIPCRTKAVAKTRICAYLNSTSAVQCTLEIPVGDRRLITYSASARSASGKMATTDAISYAGGAPLTQAPVRTPSGTFVHPWQTARPILWHTGSPSGSSSILADKLDVGFFPDVDFGTDYHGFTDGMAYVVLGAFFNEVDPVAAKFGLWRSQFNLWAGPSGADGKSTCDHTFGGDATPIAGVTDGDVILHQDVFNDCAVINPGGAGSTQTKLDNLDDAHWIFTHESGHFLLGLGDEGLAGGHFSRSDPHNLYDSLASCESAATSLGLATSLCTRLGSLAIWKLADDGQLATMAHRTVDSDWQTASGIALSRRVSKCVAGACY